MAVDTETFKRALRSWASGVTIVTSRVGDLRHGMTVSAFCSVSAEPPQVLVCVNRESKTHTVIQQAWAFGVSILSHGQRVLSELFADKDREETRFAGLECPEGVTGCPRIPGAVAHLDCAVVEAISSGTHVIYVGVVEGAEIHDLAPLTFHRGRYNRLN